MEKKKIRLEDLSRDSTPCEICVAMNGREIVLDETKDYYRKRYCHIGLNNCIDSNRAMIKLLHLNYSQNKY